MKTFLVFLMLVLAAGFAVAQTEPVQAPQETTSTTTTTTTTTKDSLLGTVDTIDMNTKTITIRDEKGKTMKYTYNTSTAFSNQDKPFTVTELKTGDRVTYVVNDGGVISTISITPGEAPPQK